jgi:hypothetical protein
MSHKRKDTLAVSKEWAKHLRPSGKRHTTKKCRAAGKVRVADVEDDEIKGFGLRKNPEEMKLFKAEHGTSVIPYGSYCYKGDKKCPYLDCAKNKEKQENGFCWFLGKGDWDMYDGLLSLLWDWCKECDVHMEELPEGIIPVQIEREVK